ncbi:MAG TPA: DUF1684 domain-containing protein [Acetobacteraceae bacterium]|nr:DUF1684 domain-containing protein [Acetobacteraceae bacterium]
MNDTVALWQWRRQIADLYGAIRAAGASPAAWARWTETRRRLFATHPQSPIGADVRESYDGPLVYAYDPDLRFELEMTPADGDDLSLEVGADGTVVLKPFARTDGLSDSFGGELTMYWIGGYGGGVFLPFADATNGRETYGGGRYLLDTIKGVDLGWTADGRVILDFNYAYFPSCAYTDRFVCPLPPPENRLPDAVRAGERL